MTFEQQLGRLGPLVLLRVGPPGAFLSLDSNDPTAPVVLLPGAEIPDGAKVGDPIEVFLHLDSEGRPIATTRMPKLVLGEVTFLEVTACTPIGAFVDWGLTKELLVPFAEQTRDLAIGDRHPIGLYIDKSGRLCGTMRVSEMLVDGGEFELDEWVEGEAWRNDPEIGLFVILERTRVGLVPGEEPHRLVRGEASLFRVASILADGKVELSLRKRAHQEVEGDAQRILDELAKKQAATVSERASADEIRLRFGMSKKAFKRAVGRLFKTGAIGIDGDGTILLPKE